jgi:peptide/nickel transport system permease protein
MLKKIEIFHVLLSLTILLFVARFEMIVDSSLFLLLSFYELFFNSDEFISTFDFQTLDLLISISLLLFSPILFIKGREKIRLLTRKVKGSYLIFIVIIFSIVFAPIITNFHPNAQPNLRATRFLKPLSSISILHLEDKNYMSDYFKIKQKVVNTSVINNKIFVNTYADSGNYINYTQGSNKKEIEKVQLLMEDDIIVVTSKVFILGTDELGRDVFARVIYGARVSLFIAFFSVIISLLIGLTLGFTAARVGGVLNLVLSRITDMFLTIPSIFFVIMILALWGNSIYAVVLVLGLTGWMNLFKIMKGEVGSIIKKDYYISSQKLGLSQWKLLLKEIFPSITTQLIIFSVFQFSNVILAEASLSYLGLGVGLNYPSWGNMILSGQKYMSSGQWLLIIPSIILVISILVINDFGEKIRNEMNPWNNDDK